MLALLLELVIVKPMLVMSSNDELDLMQYW